MICRRCGERGIKIPAEHDCPGEPLSDVERALLERDVAEVERHARSLRDALRVAPISAADHARQLLVALDLVDCRAWLTRAKAALG